jgi:hypothetical protein
MTSGEAATENTKIVLEIQKNKSLWKSKYNLDEMLGKKM